ncbi:MAG: hypothetical protein FD123_990 [Bacteroidetes bacterium]|nr:MAG: hypothetical protein FD123_990 [Bacteroidota bacterium]
MSSEQLQQLLAWLNNQIHHANTAINESRELQNYGREAQYAGMKEAFEKCLGQLSARI